jgi:hypothetical protein
MNYLLAIFGMVVVIWFGVVGIICELKSIHTTLKEK